LEGYSAWGPPPAAGVDPPPPRPGLGEDWGEGGWLRQGGGKSTKPLVTGNLLLAIQSDLLHELHCWPIQKRHQMKPCYEKGLIATMMYILGMLATPRTDFPVQVHQKYCIEGHLSGWTYLYMCCDGRTVLRPSVV
jgi:hypothetical protein